MFETLALPDASILLTKGHHLSGIRPNGSGPVVFEFENLTQEKAAAILSGSDAMVCRAFHRAWRDARRRMDAVKYGSGGVR
jgi:hypothetical protein